MLAALLTNLEIIGPSVPVIDHTHDGPPPWIRTKEQIEYLRSKQAVVPKVIEELETLLEPYTYEYKPGKPPYIDYEGIAEQAALMARIALLYQEAMQAYMISILADDDAVIAALVASGEII